MIRKTRFQVLSLLLTSLMMSFLLPDADAADTELFGPDRELLLAAAVPSVTLENGRKTPSEIETQTDKWNFSISPYGWLPHSLKGDMTVKGKKSSLDLKLHDVWDIVWNNLQMFAEVHAEAEKGKVTHRYFPCHIRWGILCYFYHP